MSINIALPDGTATLLSFKPEIAKTLSPLFSNFSIGERNSIVQIFINSIPANNPNSYKIAARLLAASKGLFNSVAQIKEIVSVFFRFPLDEMERAEKILQSYSSMAELRAKTFLLSSTQINQSIERVLKNLSLLLMSNTSITKDTVTLLEIFLDHVFRSFSLSSTIFEYSKIILSISETSLRKTTAMLLNFNLRETLSILQLLKEQNKEKMEMTVDRVQILIDINGFFIENLLLPFQSSSILTEEEFQALITHLPLNLVWKKETLGSLTVRNLYNSILKGYRSQCKLIDLLYRDIESKSFIIAMTFILNLELDNYNHLLESLSEDRATLIRSFTPNGKHRDQLILQLIKFPQDEWDDILYACDILHDKKFILVAGATHAFFEGYKKIPSNLRKKICRSTSHQIIKHVAPICLCTRLSIWRALSFVPFQEWDSLIMEYCRLQNSVPLASRKAIFLLPDTIFGSLLATPLEEREVYVTKALTLPISPKLNFFSNYLPFSEINEYLDLISKPAEDPIEFFQKLFTFKPALKDISREFLMKKISSQDEWVIQYLNKEIEDWPLLFSEEDPLIQRALEILALTQHDSFNPYTIYKNHKDNKLKPFPIHPIYHPLPSSTLQVAFNIPALTSAYNEKVKETPITNTTLTEWAAQMPIVNTVAIDTLYESMKTFLQSVIDNKESPIQSNAIELLTSINAQLPSALLNIRRYISYMQRSPLPANYTTVQLVTLFKNLGLKSTLRENGLQSDQESYALQIVDAMNRCPTGQESFINKIFLLLTQVEGAQFIHPPKDISFEQKAKDFIWKVYIDTLQDIFTNPRSKFLATATGEHKAQRLEEQIMHQTRFTLNRIAHLVGYYPHSNILFDQHTITIYKMLLKKGPKELLTIFLETIPPQTFLTNLSIAISSSKDPSIYQGVNVLLKKDDHTDLTPEELSIIWKLDEDDEGDTLYTLTNLGALKVAEQTGIVQVAPTTEVKELQGDTKRKRAS